MRPAPGELLHFSEDPTITRFVPHVAATSALPDPYVWAVNADQAPSYWFPRNCPRMMAWTCAGTTTDDRERILGPGGGERVHTIEYGWLTRLQRARLFAYRLPAAPFRPLETHAMVAEEPVEPLGSAVEVGDLLTLHAAAGIQLRLLTNLWQFVDAVAASTLGFSGIRLRYATDRMSGVAS
jgi:hypothetical protein